MPGSQSSPSSSAAGAEAAGPAESPPVARTPVGVLDLVLVVGLTAATLHLVGRLVGDPELTPATLAGLALLQSAIPLIPVWLVVVAWRGVGWADIGLRPTSTRWLLGAVMIALLSVPLVGLVNLAIDQTTDAPFRNPQVAVLAPTALSVPAAVMMFLAAAAVAPVVEEIIFRGLLYGWLRNHMGFGLSALLSGGVFAAIHGIVLLIPALLVQGIILAWFYERSRSLWPPIILHGAFNAVMMIALFGAVAAGVPLK